jgi:hypothetical protein
MTTTGRILTLVTLALSLLFASWGVSVYSNRVEFANKDSKKGGIFTEKAKQITDAEEARKLADTRLAAAFSALEGEEAQRPKLLAFYAEKIQELRSAKGQLNPLKIVQGGLGTGPGGVPLTDPPIRSLATLRDEYAQKQEDVRKVIAEVDKLIAQEAELDAKLGNGKDTGLHGDLAKEKDRKRRALEEQEKLEPLLYNALVEAQSLADRHKTLLARKKELETTAVTRQQ